MENNTLTAINGILVGHYTDKEGMTGCTVILTPKGATAGVDVSGAGPGTRETDLLNPTSMVQQVHGILLTGGSAYGLAAADGVMQWLESHGHGFPVGVAIVPIVPAAVLFDLAIGNAKARPKAEHGFMACENASTNPVSMGSVGAGTGATVGKLMGMPHATKSGIGSACRQLENGVKVAALVAVNAFGDVIDPKSGVIVAGMKNAAGTGFESSMARLYGDLSDTLLGFMQNTTIGVVATDAVMTKSTINKVASMAHDGLARTINPIHTSMDGDTIFGLATGKSGIAMSDYVIGAIAAEVMAAAVLEAVKHA